MPRFQSLAFSALLKGVRKHKRVIIQKNKVSSPIQSCPKGNFRGWDSVETSIADAVAANDNGESELAKHAVSVINEILEPNEFQLTEPLPIVKATYSPHNKDLNFYKLNRQELQSACKLFGIRGVNSRWKEETCIGKLIAGGVSCDDNGTLSREYK